MPGLRCAVCRAHAVSWSGRFKVGLCNKHAGSLTVIKALANAERKGMSR